MKKIGLLLLSFIAITFNTYAYSVSGTAEDSETGAGLAGIELDLHLENGQIQFLNTADDGTFTFNYVPDGAHTLVFHYYTPVIINGDYYLYTPYPDTIYVDGAEVTGIVFNIPPHHPVYHVSGTLYDATTNLPISDQNMSLSLDFQAHSGFFFAWSNDDGSYSFEDSIPDWTYTFNVFENDYYYGDEVQLVVDTTGPQEITMDFYLQPKSGATVTGTLYDIATGLPIPIANRTIRLSAIDPVYAETDADGNFTFVNVPPGYYANMTVTSKDTAYINCPESTIPDFIVPDSGISGVQIYQQKFQSVHVVSIDDPYYEPGATKTVRFKLVMDSDVYGSIWGMELDMPPELSYASATDCYDYWSGDVTFEKSQLCDDSSRIFWQGYHDVFGSGQVGNLDALNDSVYADVTLYYGDNMGETSTIFFKVFYNYGGCFIIQPFSYGNIILQNSNTNVGITENNMDQNHISSYPNPARDRAMISLSLAEDTFGKISLYNDKGQLISVVAERKFSRGSNTINLNTGQLSKGLYFYTFLSSNNSLSGKLIISH